MIFSSNFMWAECRNQWNSCWIPLKVAISLDFGRKFWVPKHVYQDLMWKKVFSDCFLFWGRSSSLNLSYPKFRSKIIYSIVWKNVHKLFSCFCCLNYVLNRICLCLDPEASSWYRIPKKVYFAYNFNEHVLRAQKRFFGSEKSFEKLRD